MDAFCIKSDLFIMFYSVGLACVVLFSRAEIGLEKPLTPVFTTLPLKASNYTQNNQIT